MFRLTLDELAKMALKTPDEAKRELMRRYNRGSISWNDVEVALGISPPDPDTTLTTKTSIEEAEAEHSSTGIVFGCINKQWEALKAQMQLGDELWKYEWIGGELAASEGYKLLRNGWVIAKITTFRS